MLLLFQVESKHITFAGTIGFKLTEEYFGRNFVICANAAVLESISNNCVAVGVPAKIIKVNIEIADYRSVV